MSRTVVPISRRDFLTSAGFGAAGLAAGLSMTSRRGFAADQPVAASLADWFASPAFDQFVQEKMAAAHVPGCSIAIVHDGKLLRTAGYGWANLDAKRPMRPGTLLNIASVTKTLTCTAVMQLQEQGKFQLDDPINRYLPFAIHNPKYPDMVLTVRQLLTHTSSISDGPAYEESYACGDPTVVLRDWLRDYFVPGRALYKANKNFGAWRPGQKHHYSNVAYGVLGLLIESASGMPYTEYVATNIFRPLGMVHSRFLLAGMPAEAHATPYSYIENERASKVPLLDPTWKVPDGKVTQQVPHCLFSFATPADGMARTSANELVRVMLAYMHGGRFDGVQLLRPETVAQILTDQHVVFDDKEARHAAQGLTWFTSKLADDDGTIWGHSGGDPGVVTYMGFRPADQRGLVILTNSSDSGAVRDVAKAVFGKQPVV